MPDGGSTGGAILLTADRRRIAVDVNWLTGRLRSSDINNNGMESFWHCLIPAQSSMSEYSFVTGLFNSSAIHRR
jgi:hypothetical protein